MPGSDTRGQHPGLAREGVHPLGVLRPPRLDHLDGDGAVQTPVAPLVDAAERALADGGVQLVAVVQGAAGEVGGVGHVVLECGAATTAAVI